MAKHMRVILTAEVPHLGSPGKVVQVRPGYARNYLIPRGLAVAATPAALKQFEHLRGMVSQRALRAREDALRMKEAMEQAPLTLTRRAGREDLLFEAVTRETIAAALHEQGFPVDRRQILLDQPLKRAGHYSVEIHLFEDVRAVIELNIEPRTETP